jgi:TolB-like protein/DNA-binding winged helix-turn-helix (wHTH) protein/cytochrome c-type biogenesis protein CcmH/NrfG
MEFQPVDKDIPRYCFGEYELNIERGALTRHGVEVPLRPKSFEVLSLLVSHHAELVTKEQFFDAVWPEVVVTPDSINQCIIEIRKALGDAERTMIRTVPRRGFVFDAPVTSGQSGGLPGSQSDGFAVETAHWPARRFRPLVISAVLLLSLSVAFLFWENQQREPSTGNQAALNEVREESRSLVVLPFTDLSPGGDQEFFADGITEELTNLLSHLPDLRVISRTSAFTLKGQNATMAEIAAMLNVSHVLEGSVRVDGGRLRVTAQLIEATTDSHLWSKVFERSYEKIFDIQDEVATLVTRRLEVDLLNAPPRVQRTDPDAYSLYLQAMFQFITQENFESSISKLEQALAIDSEYVPAWVMLGRRLFFQATNFGGDKDTIGLAQSAAENALRLDPYYAPAHALLGTLTVHKNDLQSAARHFERAFEIDPTDESLVLAVVSLLQSLGRFDEAVQILRIEMDRNPLSDVPPLNLALTLLMDKRLAEAEPYWRFALDLNRDSPVWVPGFYAITLAHNGKLSEALEVAQSSKDHIYKNWILIWLYQQMGMVQEYQAGLREMKHREGDAPSPGWARFYALLGHADAAFERLDLDQDATHWNRERYWPVYWPIEDDARWVPFLERMGVSNAQLNQIEFELKPRI